jgi:hypothetical protein
MKKGDLQREHVEKVVSGDSNPTKPAASAGFRAVTWFCQSVTSGNGGLS